MRKIKIGFANFWIDFEPETSFFYKILSRKYDVQISDKPDILFASVFDGELPEGEFKKVSYTGENVRPDLDTFDWAFGFDFEESISNPRYMRFPLSIYDGDLPQQLFARRKASRSKRRFCNFVHFHRVEFRENFFKKLSQYKHIDAPSRSMNNQAPICDSILEKCKQRFRSDNSDRASTTRESRYVSSWQSDKLRYISKYKFTMAFENSSFPGYTTEKLIHPMLVGSIPIYWGHAAINRDFNTKSFLNYHDYESEEEFIEKIIELDSDKRLYKTMLSEPYFYENKKPEWANRERIIERLYHIAES